MALERGCNLYKLLRKNSFTCNITRNICISFIKLSRNKRLIKIYILKQNIYNIKPEIITQLIISTFITIISVHVPIIKLIFINITVTKSFVRIPNNKIIYLTYTLYN